MTPLYQENTARRFSPSQFDCQLPEDARAELLKPQRPRILGKHRPSRPKSRPGSILRDAGGIRQCHGFWA
jgi:hypothetical protein